MVVVVVVVVVVVGCWLLVVGCWLLVVGCWLWLLVVVVVGICQYCCSQHFLFDIAQELRFKAMEEKVIPVVPIVDSKTSELPMGAMAYR